MENVLGALARIHDFGYIYNDLTPDNIMRVENSWKLNDFDSVTIEGEDSIVNRHTLLYCSPEQAINGRITSKSDIWAAGVVLYEALFKGKKPFDNQDSIVNMKFDDSRTYKTAYDELFKKIFTVPEKRPSATELINILKEIENKEI